MTAIQQLQQAGYQVATAWPGVQRVKGPGIDMYVADSDTATVAKLTDPTLQAQRAAPAPTPPPPARSVYAQVGIALRALNPATATVADLISALTPIFPVQ